VNLLITGISSNQQLCAFAVSSTRAVAVQFTKIQFPLRKSTEEFSVSNRQKKATTVSSVAFLQLTLEVKSIPEINLSVPSTHQQSHLPMERLLLL